MVDLCAMYAAEFARSAATHRIAASLAQNWYLVFAIAGSGLFWVCLHYWNRYRDRIVLSSWKPASLFLELCEAHRLTKPQRALLLKAAETRDQKHSTTVFVDPQILGSLAAGGGPDRAMYQELLTQLFGDERKSSAAAG